MSEHLIKKLTYELVEGVTKDEHDALSARVDSIVAGNTTNATGYEIITLTETVNQGSDLVIFYRFPVPANAVIIEAAYRPVYGVEQMWKNTNLKIWQTSTYVQLQVDNYSEAGTAEFKLVYSVPKPIELDELTDIRIGYDGTQYGSAGEAVRRQIGALAVANSGFNEQVKAALLNLLSHVAFVDEHGQQYYDELEEAMEQALAVTFITAVFEQGQAVIYDTDSLNDLKQYLTVTAHFEDGTSGTVTAYTLSGTLTVGTSTITVKYGGKTTTFDVTVSEDPVLWEIENQTVPSGSSAIDSYIPLLATDTDFTVLYDITIEGSVPSTTSLLRIVHSTNTSIFSLRIGRQTASDTRFTFTYMGTSVPIGNNGDIGTGRYRFVITHQNGSETAKALYRKEAGQLYEATISESFTASSKNFVLGQTSGDAFKLPQCVLHKVAIYDKVFPDSKINEFFGL